MKYLIMIYTNRKGWAELTDAQRAAFRGRHSVVTKEIAATGELVISEGLTDPAQAKLVSVRDGRTMASDGPFAEVKEHLAGFYLVDCTTIERAIEHAARLPDAEFGQVEVRPVLDLSGLDM